MYRPRRARQFTAEHRNRHLGIGRRGLQSRTDRERRGRIERDIETLRNSQRTRETYNRTDSQNRRRQTNREGLTNEGTHT